MRCYSCCCTARIVVSTTAVLVSYNISMQSYSLYWYDTILWCSLYMILFTSTHMCRITYQTSRIDYGSSFEYTWYYSTTKNGCATILTNIKPCLLLYASEGYTGFQTPINHPFLLLSIHTCIPCIYVPVAPNLLQSVLNTWYIFRNWSKGRGTLTWPTAVFCCERTCTDTYGRWCHISLSGSLPLRFELLAQGLHYVRQTPRALLLLYSLNNVTDWC